MRLFPGHSVFLVVVVVFLMMSLSECRQLPPWMQSLADLSKSDEPLLQFFMANTEGSVRV
jgi:hypothetical protein